MATFIVDRKSSYVVKLPKKDHNWIQLGQAYLAYEAAQPLENQLPLPALTTVQAAVVAAGNAAISAQEGEHRRAMAATAFTQTLVTVEEKLRWAIKGLERRFPHNLAELEAWGVDTVHGSSELLIDYPALQEEWLALLDSYIAKEESLLPADQGQDPPLAEMETLREQLQTSQQERELALKQRKQSINDRQEHVATVKMLLDLALHGLIVDKFQGKVKPQLENWGFTVQYRAAGSSNGDTAQTEPDPAETTTEPDPAPAG